MSINISLDCKCDGCRSKIDDGEIVYCQSCYSDLVLENEKLQVEIAELKAEPFGGQ